MEDRVDTSRSFYLRTYLYIYFYVCPNFYKVYRNSECEHHIYANTEDSEAIVVYQDCLKKLKQYVSEDKSYFFEEAKKLLIEYYIPTGESCRQMKIRDYV